MLATALALLFGMKAGAKPLPPPVVAIDAGRLRGTATTDGRALFRGIPFAAPPTGPLRWRPPAPARAWRGVRDASRSGPTCPQADFGWNHAAALRQKEDCLYLEVGTPSLHSGRPLPVMLWIHGGGNRGGSGAGVVDSPLVKRGIVLVSVQYRLNVFGFLSHPALGPVSGNYGLMDQQAALRWVRRNIRAFGGDPDNVTIFGQSAGGQDVGLLLLSPGARGLFHKAIEESGTPGFGLPPRSLAENEALGRLIVEKAGAPPDADAAALRRLPVAALIRASASTKVPGLEDDNHIWLQAVVDGEVLTEPPAVTLERGGQARVPLIIGNNAREMPLSGGEAQIGRTIDRVFGANAAQARAFYRLEEKPAADPRLGDLSHQVAADIHFRCPSLFVARRWAQAGLPVWSYQFDVSGPNGKPVGHSSEIRFVLGEAGARRDSAAQLAAHWARFAKTGDPNGPGLRDWPGYARAQATLQFGEGGPAVIEKLRDPVCRLRSVP